MISAFVWLVYALAVARVTRLVTADKLTEGPRDRLLDRLWSRCAPLVPVQERGRALPPLPVYLLTCPWCVSIYVAAPAAVIAYFWPTAPWFLIPALLLAFSHVTGLLAQRES
jgi:hypothetical protein